MYIKKKTKETEKEIENVMSSSAAPETVSFFIYKFRQMSFLDRINFQKSFRGLASNCFKFFNY